MNPVESHWRDGQPGASAQNGIVLSDGPDAAPPQARPGEQVAFAPAAVPIVIGAARAAPAIVNLLRGAAGALTGTAAASLSGDTPSPEQAAPPDHDQARTPDPAQPEEDRQQADAAQPAPKRGRIVIAEDGRELQVPPLEPWADKLDGEDRKVADALNDAFAIEMAKGGGGRGNLLTQRDVNIAIQECIEAAKREFPDAEIRHVYGGNQEGKSERRRLKEEHLWEYDEKGKKVRRGSRRPDWGIVIARNIVEMARGNTVDTKKNGEPSTREAGAEQGIKEKTEGEKMSVIAKTKARMTEEEFRANARKVCTNTMKELHMDWTRRGEFEKPAPQQPGDYAGPASARKAAERRRLLGQ